jgi:hypothetical protein
MLQILTSPSSDDLSGEWQTLAIHAPLGLNATCDGPNCAGVIGVGAAVAETLRMIDANNTRTKSTLRFIC